MQTGSHRIRFAAWIIACPIVAACHQDVAAGDGGGSGGIDLAIASDGPIVTGGDLAGFTPDLAPRPCPPVPACDNPPPDPGPRRAWIHGVSSPIIVAAGSPNHRGRDLFLNPGAPQWIIGKFAYGLSDKDLRDEDVDVWLDRGCSGSWEKLATMRTTDDGSPFPTTEGVEDTGGRVYHKIAPGKTLGLGWHRVRLVVAGDLSATDLWIAVVPPGTPLFVTDVDGTLTTSENVEFTALLTGSTPDIHPDAAQALGLLAQRGYIPMYMTARPEWLTGRTREFVAKRGLPRGLVHTTTTLTGATGNAAVTYKTGELAMLAQKGLVPAWAFGNTASDADAYHNGKIATSQRVFYQYTDTHGGRRIESYTELLSEFKALAGAACP